MRLVLFSIGVRYISIDNLNLYNMSVTLHAFLMIFFLIMPFSFSGVANILLPLNVATSEVSYPRYNTVSLSLWTISFFVLMLSVVQEIGNGTGWTMYAPLSTSLMSLSPASVLLMILGLLISGVGSTFSSLNFAVTTVLYKAVGYVSCYISLFVVAILITSLLLLLVLPVLTVALTMLVSELYANTMFFDSMFGGDPVLYQHLFWLFGHPEVYILILPSFGLVSKSITEQSAVLFGHNSMYLAMACIAILGAVVWSHHMFTVTMELDTRSYFTAVTMLIALPTGSKIFNWTLSRQLI